MDDLESLELLSLVSKVTSEIQNHLGVSDKTLAEFVIDQHGKSKSLSDFKAQLEEMGAEFPPSLIESIDRLCLTLHPSRKKLNGANGNAKEDEDADGETDRKTRVFKGLAIPDKDVEFEEEEGDQETKMDALDDTFAMLEGLAGKGAGKPKDTGSRKRSISPYGDGDRERSRSKRHRQRSRSRSPRRSHNDEYLFEDEFGRTRKVKRDDRGDRVSRPKYRDDEDGYGDPRIRRKHRERDDDFRRPPTPELDDEPVLFKVYKGKATGVKDFGIFVNLTGVRGKVDGLVHVSQMQEGGRVNHPSDLVSRGQELMVKVIKNEGGRLSLSMKEVDQATGRDLAPQRRIASGANMQGLGGTNEPVSIIEDGLNGRHNGMRKRMTSPERWEIKQLIASGVIPKSEYPDIDDEYKEAINGGGFEEEEDIDIEVRDEEPPFLAGQTKQSLELSPIRVVKAPDGSMNRAAMSGDTLARERRELRQAEAQEKAAKEASQVDLSSQWNDPMAQQRQFASDLRNTRTNQPAEAMPEWKKISTGRDASFGKRTSLSMKEQRETLPVFKFRKQLLEAIEAHQILIVVGDTGSGKTTQMTQYLAEAGYANELMIGCTQPRRVAAMSVAKRVAEEVGCKLGNEVGYTIRFEDLTGPDTRIKYMTDGILLREMLLDNMLSKYSCIMLDEAHERTIATDVLFGLLKKTLKRRPDMKLIVTSATLDADRFSEYFLKCPIFTIPGRTFPVEIMYSREPESDYLDAALVTVMQIHLTEPAGDILLFLTGKEEIDTSCEILAERMKALGPGVPNLEILPIYGALPSEVATRIFEPAPVGSRKVVIATNIAETSLTIDGIYYVVDPGFVKQSSYDNKLQMDRLQITPISQAQARQRSGRAGRTGPGKCFRLYTEAAFQNEMLPTSIPEIQRQNLSNTILMLKAMGINDLLHFDFMDPPPTATMLTALEELYCLGALDDEGLLTRLGRRLSDFPMNPDLSACLVKSVDLQCSDEVLTIVAMISATQNVFHRPREKQQQADQKKAKFNDATGDHLTLLNVYNAWKGSNYSTPWCFENYIQPKSMMRVKDVRSQLQQILQRHKLQQISCGRNTQKVRQALCSGFFRNSARKDPSEGYRTLTEGTPVYLHPSSALFGRPAEHVIYSSLVETTKEYMHICSAIEPKWLVEAAPTFFKVAGLKGEMSKRKKAERIQPLHNKFAGEDDWRLSAQKRQGRGGGGTWG